VHTKKTVITGILFLALIAQFTMNSAIFGSPASKNEAIAVVNGKQIYHSQLEPLLNEYKKIAKKDQASQEDKTQLVKNLIRRYLILKQDSTQELRKSKEIRDKVKEYEDQLVLDAYIKKNIVDYLKVSEEEIRQYYVNNRLKFVSPPKVEASHILLRTEEEAKLVLKKLQSGEKFTDLAKQYSIDLPMALEGGKMGVITKGKTLPQLDEALFILNEGEYSPIIKTQYGWHILRVDKKIAEQYTPYEQAKDKIRITLMQEKEAKAYDAMAQKLEKDANIKIFENRL
jgi:peptidyl-prolyl cis-trans isomerase C